MSNSNSSRRAIPFPEIPSSSMSPSGAPPIISPESIKSTQDDCTQFTSEWSSYISNHLPPIKIAEMPSSIYSDLDLSFLSNNHNNERSQSASILSQDIDF
eukprot:396344_1